MCAEETKGASRNVIFSSSQQIPLYKEMWSAGRNSFPSSLMCALMEYERSCLIHPRWAHVLLKLKKGLLPGSRDAQHDNAGAPRAVYHALCGLLLTADHGRHFSNTTEQHEVRCHPRCPCRLCRRLCSRSDWPCLDRRQRIRV